MCSNSGDALKWLLAAVATVESVTAEAGPAGVGDRIGRLLQARAQLDAVILTEVAAADAAGAWVDDGAVTTAGWLRAGHRLGRRDASMLVHQARQLRDLPATSTALAAGTLSRDHAAAIVKAKTASGLDPDQFAEFEAILVELAAQASPDEVKTAAAHLVDVEAPDRDKQLVEALAGRRFDLYPVGDLVRVDAMIDKATAEALTVAVEALSRRSPGDERTWLQRRADAFSEVIVLGLETGKLPRHGRTPSQVSVLITLDQLNGIDPSGPLLRRFGRIPASTGQRLSCDAVLSRIITDPHGDVLDVGRASRHTTTAQNKAIAAMHDACAYPNCATTLNRCDIHHVTWWSQGGTTDLNNLIPLCKQHHQFVHEHRYAIRTRHGSNGQPAPGPSRWTFTTPRGHPIPDHRHTLHHYLEQLALIADIPAAGSRPPEKVAATAGIVAVSHQDTGLP
jgi:hypothetical protein